MNPSGGRFGRAVIGSSVQRCPLQQKKKQVHWVEIQLKDEAGNPVPNERYVVKLSNGDIVRGFLDGEGKARIEGIETLANCDVSFPDLDKEAW